MQKTSIIMSCSPNEIEYLMASVDSIRRYTEGGTYQLIIVEHSNKQAARSWLTQQTDVLTLFHEEPLTRAQAWNVGLKAATGDNVLFLHSDTLVTENWLAYMVQSLNQDRLCAGVGPLTNYAQGDQGATNQFSSINELLTFAAENGRSIRQSTRLTLSDFCMLFKKELVDQIGTWNEQLDGQALAIDYSLRIAQAGYRLVLCKHVFLHHYGEGDEITPSQKEQFKRVWGFNIGLALEKSDTLALMPTESEESLHILEVGSGCGATLLNLKQRYSNAAILGIENDEQAASISRGLDIATKYDFTGLEENKYDLIILNTANNIEITLQNCYGLLRANGKMIFDFPNVYQYATVLKLLKGEDLLDQNNLDRIMLPSILDTFEQSGFDEIQINYVKSDLKPEETHFINGLKHLVQHELPLHFDVTHFLITAYKQMNSDILHEQFNLLFQAPSEEILDQILQYSMNSILKAAVEYSGPVIPLLNYLAISNYERKQNDHIFPLLMRAYEMDSLDSTTLFNLGTICYGLGEEENALNWLKKIPEKSGQVDAWIYELEENLSLKKNPDRWLKFLLFRVEHNVQREDSLLKIIRLVQSQTIQANTLRKTIQENMLDKLNTINILINGFYENQQYAVVIDLLNFSLNYGTDQQEITKLIHAIQGKIEKF